MKEKIKALMQSDTVKKFIKFGITGGLNSLVDFLVYSLLFRLLGTGELLAQIVGYSAGTLNSYIFNKSWTFQDRGKFFSPKLVKFIVVNLVSLGVSLLVMEGLVHFFEFHWIVNKILVTGVTICINFAGSRLWVFKD